MVATECVGTVLRAFDPEGGQGEVFVRVEVDLSEITYCFTVMGRPDSWFRGALRCRRGCGRVRRWSLFLLRDVSGMFLRSPEPAAPVEQLGWAQAQECDRVTPQKKKPLRRSTGVQRSKVSCWTIQLTEEVPVLEAPTPRPQLFTRTGRAGWESCEEETPRAEAQGVTPAV